MNIQNFKKSDTNINTFNINSNDISYKLQYIFKKKF